jgi:hypothetical protein
VTPSAQASPLGRLGGSGEARTLLRPAVPCPWRSELCFAFEQGIQGGGGGRVDFGPGFKVVEGGVPADAMKPPRVCRIAAPPFRLDTKTRRRESAGIPRPRALRPGSGSPGGAAGWSGRTHARTRATGRRTAGRLPGRGHRRRGQTSRVTTACESTSVGALRKAG